MSRTPNFKRNKLVQKLVKDGELSYAEIAKAIGLRSKSTIHWIAKNGKVGVDK